MQADFSSLVHRIEMPTPYAVGPVNAYLLAVEPLTLIDAGINTPQAQNALVLGIAEAGCFLEGIERVLITHAHPDHYGLVHVIQEASGATVHVPEREMARIRDRQMLFEVGRLLMGAGMPLDLLFKMDQQRRGDPRPKLDHDSVVPVHDGDTFSVSSGAQNWVLEAHLMPGHTGGHVVYFEPESRTMFAGDQLLPEVSPNPLLEPSIDAPGERRRSLREYLNSLHAMEAMEPSLVYPGHGAPVAEPAALITSLLEHHAKRKSSIAGMLDDDGKTPYELAQEVYPDVSGYDSFLAVSEVIAHLDLVVEDGDAFVEERDGISYYRMADT
ncbi:MAG TPA: MBL fold metallo-hydrolase [Actinomycetota bacterium]|nr:MBL fold metallo-hydrolase [Actinomycetota bacterium]